ncbi:tetratricopeptide repeat protein [Pararhodobacter oceanensis]|uniref:Ancillary SecYEG translocon subunit/Cell division coordinator CpoB TPR domain-containing protein n=1 Tax=Pararhodobacter oceanensis TaxID=2172121 RepID=A0A2T8HZG6_9RHOB|nr:tetratricopeptide repeat protein [Pararhodobacter oceanensis]PVH30817.1 hypothetical protein DDE20_02375 [Pararhodobacter oceanensis]
MSNPESFIDEVNEELKRDRLFATMRKYAPIAILAVIVLVGGAAWNEWRKAQATSQAQAFGDAIVTALDSEDPQAQRSALAALEGELEVGGDRAGILNLLLAATELNADQRPAAIDALEAVENNADLPSSYRQIAALKRVIIGGAEIPLDEREQVLNGLAAPGQAFRPLALEQLALLALESGDRETALSRAEALLQEADVTAALRRRVAQLIVVLGGDQPSDLG